MLRDRRHRQAHIRKRKIVGNQSAPSGRAKLNWAWIHHGSSAHTVVFYPSFLNTELPLFEAGLAPPAVPCSLYSLTLLDTLHEAQRQQLPPSPSYLRQPHPSQTYCPQRRRKTPRRLRQHPPQPDRIPLSLERKDRKSPRTPAPNQNHVKEVRRAGTGSKSPPQLRSPRIHRPTYRRRLPSLPGLDRRKHVGSNASREGFTGHESLVLSHCVQFSPRQPQLTHTTALDPNPP